LNKAELVSAVAEKADMSKKDSEKAVKAVFEVIEESLAQSEKVQLVGFGTFEVPAAKVPGFKAGKALKDAVQK